MVDIVVPSARPAAPQYQSRGFIGTRNQLPAGEAGRRIALDFNSADNPTPGVEIVVPKNVSDEELKASKAYVEGVAKLFDKYGYGGYALRTSDFHPGVKRRTIENSSGKPNTFHTEPFFAQDEKARTIFMKPEFQKEYVQLLNSTLRTIPDSVILAPHGVPNSAGRIDPGASFRHDGKTVSELSLGLSLINQMFPGQEPTSEAEIARQQDDPIGAIILANADISPNDNTSANDSIGAALAAGAQTQAAPQSLAAVMLPPTPSRRLPTWLDINTSPEATRRQFEERPSRRPPLGMTLTPMTLGSSPALATSPSFSLGQAIHAQLTGQTNLLGTSAYDPGAMFKLTN